MHFYSTCLSPATFILPVGLGILLVEVGLWYNSFFFSLFFPFLWVRGRVRGHGIEHWALVVIPLRQWMIVFISYCIIKEQQGEGTSP